MNYTVNWEYYHSKRNVILAKATGANVHELNGKFGRLLNSLVLLSKKNTKERKGWVLKYLKDLKINTNEFKFFVNEEDFR